MHWIILGFVALALLAVVLTIIVPPALYIGVSYLLGIGIGLLGILAQSIVGSIDVRAAVVPTLRRSPLSALVMFRVDPASQTLSWEARDWPAARFPMPFWSRNRGPLIASVIMLTLTSATYGYLEPKRFNWVALSLSGDDLARVLVKPLGDMFGWRNLCFTSTLVGAARTFYVRIRRSSAKSDDVVSECVRAEILSRETSIREISAAHAYATQAANRAAQVVGTTRSVSLVASLDNVLNALVSENLISLLNSDRESEFLGYCGEIAADAERLRGLAEDYLQFGADPTPEPDASSAGSSADPYSILRVPSDASFEQVTAVFHKLVKIYHPDAGIMTDHSEFVRIKAAYDSIARSRRGGA